MYVHRSSFINKNIVFHIGSMSVHNEKSVYLKISKDMNFIFGVFLFK